MTHSEWVAVEKAYDDLIECFQSAGNHSAVITVGMHKTLAKVKFDTEADKEAEYANR